MGCAKMLRIIDALTGVFASSAEAPGAHAPSVRRVPARSVAPVLELVLDLDGLARELAELPHGDETRAQLGGERPAEDEPTRLDGDHDVHALLLIAAREHVDHVVERRTVLEKGGDVLEEDPLGWEVPDVTDLRPEVGDVHRAPILRAPCRSAQDAAARRRQRARVTPNGRPSVRSPTSVRRAPRLNPRIS